MRWESDWIENRTRLHPDDVAIVDAETSQRWTYQQLEQRVQELAVKLLDAGLSKGDRIALLSPNHISYFDLFFACRRIGAIFVPLNWRLSRKEIASLVEDCSPKCIAFHSRCHSLTVGLNGHFFLQVDSTEYEQLGSTIESQIKKSGYDSKSKRIPPAEMEESDPCAIVYTGGTTGKSKGVVLTNGSIFWNSINTILSWKLSSNDITVTYMPMFHSGGLNALTLPLLHCGGTVVIAQEFEVEKALKIINQEGCTIILMVPTMYHMIVQSPIFHVTNFPTMHTFLSGGAPCPLSIYQSFKAKGLLFKEGYGLTEAGPNNFYIHPDQVKKKRGSVGKPMFYNRVKLVDDCGAEVGLGAVGEVAIQGGHLFDHYWNNQEATEEALRDGWLYTGDLGTRDEDGDYYIVGRKKDMIITGGENVYPLEVEHIISQHDVVREVSVIGLPDEKWGEIVTAVIVVHDGLSLSEEDVKAYCFSHLGRYKVPKRVIFVSEIPKTPVGKIDKKEMKILYSVN
jgi:fatty-acyl-CoA synthase